MKFLLKFFAVFGFLSSVQLFGAYTDEFGPLQSYYTMGDFVRYTVTPGLNIYSGSVDIPYAKDIKAYNKNVGNLYNAVGYLYGGWTAVQAVRSAGFKWLALRKSGGGSLSFDNNTAGVWSTFLTSQASMYNTYAASGVQKPSSVIDADNCTNLKNLTMISDQPDFFGSSNPGTYNPYVLAMGNPLTVAPYIQFFGGRLAHILGAVTNDVPASTTLSGPTIATGSPMPQFAIMSGSAYTAANAPAGSVTPSTAHFGTVANFLNSLELAIVQKYPYLQSHLLPTVTRLASLFSYEISMDEATQNFIRIKSSNENVSYDNGVIVQIQNNTGDTLQINQMSSGGYIPIGSLNTNQNNYFLHTASLMADGAPTSGNMIEIQDATAQTSIFIQLASPSDLKTLLSTVNSQINSSAGQTSLTLAYNQHDQKNYEALNGAAYVVLTNFDPTALSSDLDTLLMYRVQAINVVEFLSKPYFLTLQINKEQVGVGIQPTIVATESNQNPPAYGSAQNVFMWGGATEDSFILYPSIVSAKVCSWKNSYDNAVGSYSKMPLLLIPESIIQANIAGLQAHYGIWLMSYVAAMTEFNNYAYDTDFNDYECSFGDNYCSLNNIFNISAQSPSPIQPSRVVIDSSVLLQSGNTVSLSQPAITLMGSDVWDYGNLCVPGSYNFHQDIPVLHLYQNKQTQTIEANQAGGDYINFAVTFDSANLSSDPFGSKYGRPFENVMLFSLSTQDMQDGVIGELIQTASGDYQLLLKDQIGNVLAVGKVFDVVASSITVQFLNTNNNAAWNSSVQLPANIASVAVGSTAKFILNAVTSASKNSLEILKYISPVALPVIQKKNYDDVVKALNVSMNQLSVYDSTLKDQNKMPEFFNFNIGSRAGLMFFKNKWGAKPVAPDISSILQNGSWETGISLLLLALDQNNKVSYVADPSSFYLMVFDTKTGNNLGEVAVPLSSFTTNFKNYFSDSNSWSNTIDIGYAGQGLPDVQYPVLFTIQKSAATVTDLSNLSCQQLVEKLLQAGKTVQEVKVIDSSLVDSQSATYYILQNGQETVKAAVNQTMPKSFNVNLGARLGFMFFVNMWYSTQPIAPDITSILQKGSWAEGMSLFFFGVDAKNNIILDLTKVEATSFYAAIYNTTTGFYLGGITVPMASATRNGLGFKDTSPWPQDIAFGYDGAGKGSGQYPAVLTMTNQESVSIQPLIQKLSKAELSAEKTSKKSFVISEVLSKNYSTLYTKLNKIGSSIAEVQGYYPALSSSLSLPKFFNFNIGSRAGLMFFENQWSALAGMQSGSPIAPDISGILKSGSWANGISMILLAIDQFNHVMTDMTTVNLYPVSFYLLMYDAKTGAYLGSVVVPMSSFTKNFSVFTDSSPWTNAIGVGGDSGFSLITPGNTSYPFVFTLSNKQSVSIQKLVGALSGQQVAAKQAAVQTAQQAAAAAAQAAELKKHKKTFYITEVQSSDYITLDQKLQKFKKSLSEVQAHDSGLQDSLADMYGYTPATMPGYFNFDIGSRLSFAFFKNMWPAPVAQRPENFFGSGFGSGFGSEPEVAPIVLPLAPDITNILVSAVWSTGVSIVLLGLDTYGNVILDLTSSDLASFYLIAYNTKTRKNLGSVAIAMSDATQDAANFSSANPWSNDIVVNGSFDEIAPTKSEYPVVLTIYSKNKVSIKNIVEPVVPVAKVITKTAPKTPAQIAAEAAAKKAAQKISEKSFALSEVESKNYQTLYQKLKAAGKNLDEIEISDTSLQDQDAKINSSVDVAKLISNTMPDSFNVSFAKRAQFWFFSPKSKVSNLIAGMTDLLAKGSWTKGISLVLVAIDEFGNLILDMTQLDPVSFYLLAYETKTGKYLGSKPFTIANAVTNSGKYFDKNPWINTITVGGFGKNSVGTSGVLTITPKDRTAQYPVVLTISNQSNVSIKSLEEIGKTQKPVAKPVVVPQQKNGNPIVVTSGKTITQKETDTVPAVSVTYLSLQKVATYSDLAQQVKLMPEHEIQYPAITPQTRPLTIILGIDYLGYIFFQDFSNTAKFVTQFYPALNAKLNWAHGVRFVLLGFDKDSKLITDATFTKQLPMYFAVFLYDGVTGNFIGSQPLEISQTHTTPILGMKCVVDTVQATGSYPSCFMIKSAVIKK